MTYRRGCEAILGTSDSSLHTKNTGCVRRVGQTDFRVHLDIRRHVGSGLSTKRRHKRQAGSDDIRAGEPVGKGSGPWQGHGHGQGTRAGGHGKASGQQEQKEGQL